MKLIHTAHVQDLFDFWVVKFLFFFFKNLFLLILNQSKMGGEKTRKNISQEKPRLSYLK